VTALVGAGGNASDLDIGIPISSDSVPTQFGVAVLFYLTVAVLLLFALYAIGNGLHDGRDDEGEG